MFTVGKKFLLHGVEAEVRGNVDGEFIVFRCPSFDFGYVYKGLALNTAEYALRHGDLQEMGC